jgi:single-stranded-DNA-specific exonuclease
VGVAYKLIQQLYKLAGCAGDEADLLDLVALGIVADVAEQVHDARYLLQIGLDQLRRTRRTGLLALMEVSRVPPSSLTTDAIGFQIGPRMNALGRLEDATVSVELLTTRDAIRAGQLAAKLERLNQQRRLLTSQITSAALEMIDRNPQLLDYNALVLAHPAWHAGIVGIVASRLVEEFNRPAVLLLNPPGEPARGSARSIDGVDIGASIAGCSHLLLTHGGHPGAAGVSLLPENIDAFRRELDRQIEQHRTGDGPPGLPIDAALQLDEIDLALVEQIERLAPFGNGNPAPQFISRNLQIVDDRRIGRDGQHRKFMVQQGESGRTLPVLWFNHNDAELPPPPLDLVYTLNINEYQGERSVQLMYVASRTAEAEAAPVAVAERVRREVHDLRLVDTPAAELPPPDRAAWYAEGALLSEAVPYAPRGSIRPAGTLVLWSTPPSPELLRWLLDTVEPQTVYLCGRATTDDALPTVLRHMAGMCKYALGRDGRFPLTNAAARLGSTVGVVRHGLLWLETKGVITLVEWPEDDVVQIAAGSGVEDAQNRAQLQAELDEQLAEVRAYRRFFRRAKLEELGLG